MPGDPSVERRWLIGLGGAFFVGAALLLTLASPRRSYEVEALDAQLGHPSADADGVVTIVLDARRRDLWTGYDFTVGQPAEEGTADLLLQRARARAPRGAMMLPAGPLLDATIPLDAHWEEDITEDGSTFNPALQRWYRFSFITGGLESRDALYAIRLVRGAAVMRFVTWGCPNGESGCITLKYRVLGEGE